MCRLIFLAGEMLDETLPFRRSDVDIERPTLQIRSGETRAARRTLFLMREAVEILRWRLAATKDGGPEGWLFPSERLPGHHITKLNSQHDEACRKSGVSFRLYDLRHTFATRLAESGCDVNTLAAILGHSGLRMVTRYVHPTDQHKAEAMRRLEETLYAKPQLRRVK